jgi:hypothetical protein
MTAMDVDVRYVLVGLRECGHEIAEMVDGQPVLVQPEALALLNRLSAEHVRGLALLVDAALAHPRLLDVVLRLTAKQWVALVNLVDPLKKHTKL